MIIIGDDRFSNEKFYNIKVKEDIANTPSNATVSLAKSEIEIQKYCKDNLVRYAVMICDMKEAIYANNLAAKYIICSKDLAVSVQKLAENYMFDAKILVSIKDENEIEWAAINEIDGVIYL